MPKWGTCQLPPFSVLGHFLQPQFSFHFTHPGWICKRARWSEFVFWLATWSLEVFFFHHGKRLVLALVKVSLVHLSNNLESRKSRQILHPQICMKPVVSVHSTRVRLVKKLWNRASSFFYCDEKNLSWYWYGNLKIGVYLLHPSNWLCQYLLMFKMIKMETGFLEFLIVTAGSVFPVLGRDIAKKMISRLFGYSSQLFYWSPSLKFPHLCFPFNLSWW